MFPTWRSGDSGKHNTGGSGHGHGAWTGPGRGPGWRLCPPQSSCPCTSSDTRCHQEKPGLPGVLEEVTALPGVPGVLEEVTAPPGVPGVLEEVMAPPGVPGDQWSRQHGAQWPCMAAGYSRDKQWGGWMRQRQSGWKGLAGSLGWAGVPGGRLCSPKLRSELSSGR